MRMKSQLSLIISFQVETSLTIVLFLLLCSYYYPTMISAEQGGKYGGGYSANMLDSRGVSFRNDARVILCLLFSLSSFFSLYQRYTINVQYVLCTKGFCRRRSSLLLI